MKTQHTPGPWRNPEGSVSVFADNPTKKVCDMSWQLTGAPQAYANARLIAAAPTLLATCGTVLDCLLTDGYGESSFIVMELRKAIAKATGGE